MKDSKAEHWITAPRLAFGSVVSYGVSQWDVVDGRLRREVRRSTRLRSVEEMVRWARRHGVDAAPTVAEWRKLVAREASSEDNSAKNSCTTKAVG